MILKLFYTIFLALTVALFVGLGIDAFYPGPKMPDYPVELNSVKPTCDSSQEQIIAQNTYDQAMRDYNEKTKPYNRNVSIIAFIFAVIILAISLVFLSKIKMIADGILLGGVFTTIYAIIRGLISEDTKFRFLIVALGLIVALTLGYIKFIRAKEDQ
jgi:hypothetical protein